MIINDIVQRAAEIAGPDSTAKSQLSIQHDLDDARRHGQLIIHYAPYPDSVAVFPMFRYQFMALMQIKQTK